MWSPVACVFPTELGSPAPTLKLSLDLTWHYPRLRHWLKRGQTSELLPPTSTWGPGTLPRLPRMQGWARKP